MKNIVISLEAAVERRKHIKNEFQKHNVNFEFFNALTPDTAEEYARTLGLNIETIRLTRGELACMMSHVAIWKKAIDENISYITIFEDDVYLGEDANRLLNSTEWIKPDWNIIKIETVLKKTILANNSYRIAKTKREIAQLKSKHLGTGGYILSRKGALRFFDYINSTNLRPLDELIFQDFITKCDEPVYQIRPALCVQEIILSGPDSELLLPSLLLRDRQDRMKSDKIKGLKKVRRELNRFILQVKQAVLAKEIPFL